MVHPLPPPGSTTVDRKIERDHLWKFLSNDHTQTTVTPACLKKFSTVGKFPSELEATYTLQPVHATFIIRLFLCDFYHATYTMRLVLCDFFHATSIMRLTPYAT